MNMTKGLWLNAAFFAALIAVCIGCTDQAAGNTNFEEEQDPVQFTNLIADGSVSATTTKLTLTFDKDIEDLTSADIALDAGTTCAIKGKVTRIGVGKYELTLSGISAGGQIMVSVAKTGFAISSNSKTVTIFYYHPTEIHEDIAVAFNGLTANGSVSATTTKLTLTLDKDIQGLMVADIALNAGTTGAAKGELSRTGVGVYELELSSINAGGQVSVSLAKAGYAISPITKMVTVFYFYPNEVHEDIVVTFVDLVANGSDTVSTTKLTLIFDKDIEGLAAADIIFDAGITGAITEGLNRTGAGVYELVINGITQGGWVMVLVAKVGYNLGPDNKTVYCNKGQNKQVTFDYLQANGDSYTSTTTLTLYFSESIIGLSANDIIIDPNDLGIVKGTLSSSIYYVAYELAITGIDKSGEITVSVAKDGYDISSPSKTITVYSKKDNINFEGLTANGNWNVTTTALTLIFDQDIPGFSIDDITIDANGSGVKKGTLARIDTGKYELTIHSLTKNGRTGISITMQKEGYTIHNNTNFVDIYYFPWIYLLFAGPTQEYHYLEFVLTSTSNTFSHGSDATLKLKVNGEFSGYAWYMDGILLSETGSELTVQAANYTAGNHWLTIVLYTGTTANPVPWSAEYLVKVLP